MQYMKVAIYALTFLTYAYSGYGSNMISSLRDAIIAAEAIFGDVFKNLIAVARKFKIVHEVFDAAVEENCVYKCPNGATPAKNKFYTPSADGCGAMGMKISTEYLPAIEMENCCNVHDLCYDTCNSDKELCDLDFKRCLYKYCDSYEKSIVTDLVVKGCKGAAKMLFTGTITLGCKSYLDSQERACYCPSTYDNTKNSNSNFNKKEYREKTKPSAPNKDSKEYNKNSNPNVPNKENKDYNKNGNNQNYGWKDINDL